VSAALPRPVAGLVVRYSFLWREEAAFDLEECSKDRPCAVILVTQGDEDQQVVTTKH
jgi:hypothetical protein